MLKVCLLLRLGAKHEVHDGMAMSFWLDHWVGDGPLCSNFPLLFAITDSPNALFGRFGAMALGPRL